MSEETENKYYVEVRFTINATSFHNAVQKVLNHLNDSDELNPVDYGIDRWGWINCFDTNGKNIDDDSMMILLGDQESEEEK